MPNYEQFGLNAVARLVDPITDSQTTLQVTTTDRFPITGNFRITVGIEIMLVTTVTGITFTVVRAQEGTTGVAHDAGAPVVQPITAGSIEQSMLENIPLIRDSSRPLLNTLVDSSGGVLTGSSFTWDNQGAATRTDLDAGGVSLFVPAVAATNVRGLYKTAPSAPYILKVAFVPQLQGFGGCSMGIGFRDGVTGNLTTIHSGRADLIAVLKFTSATATGTSLFASQAWMMGRHVQWFMIEDDNTDLIYYTGLDGINFQEIHRHTRASEHTNVPNQIFWFGNSRDANVTISMALIAWEES